MLSTGLLVNFKSNILIASGKMHKKRCQFQVDLDLFLFFFQKNPYESYAWFQLDVQWFNVCSLSMAYIRKCSENHHFPIARLNIVHGIHAVAQIFSEDVQQLAGIPLEWLCHHLPYSRTIIFVWMCPLWTRCKMKKKQH